MTPISKVPVGTLHQSLPLRNRLDSYSTKLRVAVKRLSHMAFGRSHVACVAILWRRGKGGDHV